MQLKKEFNPYDPFFFPKLKEKDINQSSDFGIEHVEQLCGKRCFLLT